MTFSLAERNLNLIFQHFEPLIIFRYREELKRGHAFMQAFLIYFSHNFYIPMQIFCIKLLLLGILSLCYSYPFPIPSMIRLVQILNCINSFCKFILLVPCFFSPKTYFNYFKVKSNLPYEKILKRKLECFVRGYMYQVR